MRALDREPVSTRFPHTYRARSISILCTDAEVPRCWSLGIAC
jgi:hypothetical protein